MHDKEIQYFTDALLLIRQEFFVDAIVKLKDLIGEYPNSDLADDAQYNIGLCYYQLNQFEKSIEAFNYLIANYPEGSISVLDGGNEFGKTTAKAYLGIMNCYLGLGKAEEAEKLLPVLKKYSSNTYVLVNDIKKTYEEIAIESMELFKHKIN